MRRINLIFEVNEKGQVITTLMTYDNSNSSVNNQPNNLIVNKFSDDGYIIELDRALDEVEGGVNNFKNAFRCIIRQAEVVTTTTNKLNKKEEIELLSELVKLPKHSLITDFLYRLEDTDYYIYSFINNKILSKIKSLRKHLNFPFKVVTENQLCLSILEERYANKRITEDIALIYEHNGMFKCYLTSELGVSYRIVVVSTIEEVNVILRSAGIKKVIPLNTKAKIECPTIIRLRRGNIVNTRAILYMQKVESSERYVDGCEAEELGLYTNSVDYEKLGKLQLPKKAVIQMAVITSVLIITIIVGTVFAFSGRGKNAVIKLIDSTINKVQSIDDTENEYKILHDKVLNFAKQCNLNVGTSDVEEGVVIIRLLDASQEIELGNFIELLQENNYDYGSKLDEDSGNLLIAVKPLDIVDDIIDSADNQNR